MDQDWICTVKWVQATLSDGTWLWTLWLVDKVDGEQRPKLNSLAEGAAFTKLGVYWQVWRTCRKRGLRFNPWPWSKTWVSGEIPPKDETWTSPGETENMADPNRKRDDG